jgi:hypothetical protein
MRPSRRPWLALLACAAAAGGVAAQTQPAPEGAPGLPIGALPEGEAAGSDWRVPPVRMAGSLAYDLRATRGSGEPSSISHLLTANIGLRSYLYQPWFATVSGTLGLTSDWTRQGIEDASTTSLAESVRRREQFATGNARIDVFPQSRFPFEAHVERTDSRIDSGLASSLDFRTSDIGFSQRYRPAAGAFTLAGSFDHRQQSGLGLAATQDSVNGDFGTHWKAQELSLAAAYSRARSAAGDDDSRFSSLVARHQYAPDNALSLNTTANWTRTEERALAAPSDLQVLQASTVGLWHRENSPLTLTGSGRYLALREDTHGSTLESAGANLGVNYEINRNLRLTGTGGVNTTRSGAGATATGFTGSAGLAYQADAITLLGGRYEWFANGTAGAALNDNPQDESERQTTLNLQLGHGYTRGWSTGEQSALNLHAGQTLTWLHNRSSLHRDDALAPESARTLLNTLAATWQNGGAERSAYARLSYSDAIEAGRSDRFQLLNFQLSGNLDFGNRRSLSGDLTLQHTRQQVDALALGGESAVGRSSSRGASGEIVFQQQRPFGIPQLRFLSRLKLAQDVLKQAGTLPSLPDRETRLWENRLDYSIGRLETQLLLRFSEVDGRRRQSLLFRVQRSFGD